MSSIDYADKLRRHDSTGQFEVLKRFPDHIAEGIAIGKGAELGTLPGKTFSALVVCGMGGSAIGGDILRSLGLAACRIPVLVNRAYRLPAFVGPSTLVVVMSYSGGTEESLSAYAEARDRGASLLAVTTGGELGRRAAADGVPVITVPGGLAPRAALGYLFFPLFVAMHRLGIVPADQEALAELPARIRERVSLYARFEDPRNEAVAVAEKLHRVLPVIYSSREVLDAVAMRWRCQIEENAKSLAYGNVVPELNHNEIVGWERNPDLLKRIAVIALRDPDEHPRIARRLDVTLDLVRPLARTVIECKAGESRPLARVFGLICLGDWVSFFLAIGTDTDPFPIHKIDALKHALAAL